jgi:hypothetical protein
MEGVNLLFLFVACFTEGVNLKKEKEKNCNCNEITDSGSGERTLKSLEERLMRDR